MANETWLDIGIVAANLRGVNRPLTEERQWRRFIKSTNYENMSQKDRSILMEYGEALSGWCQTRYMPRIASVYGKDPDRLPFDFPEVLAAIAPRHLYIHAPLGDTNFRVQSVKRCAQAASAVYRLLGAPDRIVAVYPPGGHGFPREARVDAYRFIDEALGVK